MVGGVQEVANSDNCVSLIARIGTIAWDEGLCKEGLIMNVEVTLGECRTVRVGGELDLSNVGDLRTAIDDAIDQSPQGFIIDLTDVTYMDSAGVAIVISAYRRLSKAGGRLAVVTPKSKNVRRILDLIGLEMLPGVIVRQDAASAEDTLAAGSAEEDG